MKEVFIKNIKTQNCPIVGDIEIALSTKKRQHLIITGKNGSGKTTFLKTIEQRFKDILQGQSTIYQLKEIIDLNKSQIASREKQIQNTNNSNHLDSEKRMEIEQARIKIENHKSTIKDYEGRILEAKKLQIEFSDFDYIEAAKKGELILAFFEAQRQNKPNVPKAITNVDLKLPNPTKTKDLHKKFIEYMVRLRTSYLNEKDKLERGYIESKEKAEQIKEWFAHFEKTLQNLFEKDDLRLEYDDEGLNYKIMYESRCFALNELSDGYSSLLAILTELILRMEAKGFKSYDMQGVVLIDEVETHLHVSLQKKVLPFLCSFFPKIQFIVTTHSPFVLSSLDNAVICDLEKKIITEDLSAYSYDALIESYFDNDKYSQELKDKIARYEELSQKDTLTEIEQEDKKELSDYLEKAPTFNAKELEVKLNEIKLHNLARGERQ